MTTALSMTYHPRPIRCLGVWEPAGWRMKLYGISHSQDGPRQDLVAAAKTVAEEELPSPPISHGRYGVGFVGAHEARGGCVVFVDWWADENELHHHVFMAPSDAPTELRRAELDGATGCVWDLAVIGFERDAWLATVLGNADGPDFDAYLAAQLNADL